MHAPSQWLPLLASGLLGAMVAFVMAITPPLPSGGIQTAHAAAAPTLLISEYLANATGDDTNKEYVELIATGSINFAATPYSVVFTNNGTATANGWVQGSSISYGFNITSGSVNKGD